MITGAFKRPDMAMLNARLARVGRSVTPAQVDRVVDRVALKSLARLVRDTPKKWTGNTRRAWTIKSPREGVRQVQNASKVMRFLEFGTANEGTGWIYPVVKKALYIPLTARAAHGGWNPSLIRGTDFILRLRVRGIKPRRIAQKEEKVAKAELLADATAMIRKAVHG